MLDRLLTQYAAVRARLDELEGDKGDDASRPFAPASAGAIAKLEASLPAPLPPSYRKFLARHDGWANFWGALWLAGASGKARAWIDARVADWRKHVGPMKEDDGEWFDPAAQIVLGADDNGGFLVFAREAGPDGERAVLDMPRCFEENRWDNFETFLAAQLDYRRRAVAKAEGSASPRDAKPTLQIRKPATGLKKDKPKRR
jgi:hypothetical protein